MKRFLVVGAVFIVGAGAFWSVGTFPASSREPITIGFIGSLTGSLASSGQEAQRSIMLAVSQINAEGGINGRTLKVVYEDGACDSSASAAAAHKLIDVEHVHVVLSYCSLEAMTTAPIAEQAHVLHFSATASSPNVTHAGDYTFRLAPSDTQPAAELASLLSAHYTRIAIISETSEFTNTLRQHVLGGLAASSTPVVFDESFPSGTTDFRSTLVKLKHATPDAVIVNANSPVTAGLLLKQMRQLGIQSKSFGLYYGADAEFLKTAGSASEGFTYYIFSIDEKTARMQKFISDYKNMYGAVPPSPTYASLSYDGVFIIGQALSNVGDAADALKQYLYSMAPFQGVSGAASFDANGDSQGYTFSLFEVHNGASIPKN